MRKITRRQLVLGAAGVAALASVASLVEPRRVTVERHRLSSGVGGAGRTIRVIQLSDLHLRKFDAHARAVVRHVNELEPDLVAITGDAIDKPDRIGVLDEFLAALENRSPKFASLGNWEHWAGLDLAQLRGVYGEHGCDLLVNESKVVPLGGARIVVTGLDDSTGGRPDPDAAFAGLAVEPNHLVLAHSPVYRDHLSHWVQQRAGSERPSITCVLAGHTHGGQVNVFGWAPLRPPGSGDYVSGWYREGGLPLYVSRGIGTSIAPIRLGAPPEISVFDWQTAAA